MTNNNNTNKIVITSTIIAITVLFMGLSNSAFADHVFPSSTCTDGHCLDPAGPGVDWSYCDKTGEDLTGANLSFTGISPVILGGVACGAGTRQVGNLCEPDVTQSQLDTCNANLDTAEGNLNICTADNTQLTADSAQLQSDIDNLNNVVIPGLEDTIYEKMDTIAVLNSQITDLNAQIT